MQGTFSCKYLRLYTDCLLMSGTNRLPCFFVCRRVSMLACIAELQICSLAYLAKYKKHYSASHDVQGTMLVRNEPMPPSAEVAYLSSPGLMLWDMDQADD